MPRARQKILPPIFRYILSKVAILKCTKGINYDIIKKIAKQYKSFDMIKGGIGNEKEN